MGKRLRIWLIINEMKVGEFAKEIGISAPYATKLMQGHRPGVDIAKKIEKVTDGEISAAFVLGLESLSDIKTTDSV
jgi:transcriptional regulator with XRE-family HTH domain